MNKWQWAYACSVVAFAFPGVCFAQQEGSAGSQVGSSQVATDSPDFRRQDGGLQDIVVTAQKRAENLQDVPIAVSALSADDLSERRVDSIDKLNGLAPNVTVGRVLGIPFVSVRGIGTNVTGGGADASVAVHIDGVYVSRPRAQVAGFFDVEGIEVLRGPQGTLYGRNATGGSVNVTTRKPTDTFEGYADISLGNYDARELSAAVGGPLVSGGAVKFRLAGTYIKRDPMGRNTFTGTGVDNRDEFGLRGQIAVDPFDGAELLVSVDHYEANDRSGGWQYLGPARDLIPLNPAAFGGVYPSGKRYEIHSDIDPQRKLNTTGVGVTGKVDLGSDFELRSIFGYRRSRASMRSDLDHTQILYVPLRNAEKARQYSEELQLNYKRGPLTWILGGYYFNEKIFGIVDVQFRVPGYPPGAGFNTTGDIDTTAYAVFTQGDYEFGSGFGVTAGIRYSHEKKKSVGETLGFLTRTPFTAEKSWNAFTPRLAIRYNPSRQLLLYASVERGFKSGQFIAGDANPPVNPEYVWAYEAGMKTRWFDDRLQANAAVFYYDYTDLQVARTVGTRSITENAGTARTVGAELELLARPWRSFTASLNVARLSAKSTDYVTSDAVFLENGPRNWKGYSLANAPKWQVSGRVEEVIESAAGPITLSMDATYTSKVFFNPFEAKYTYQPGVTVVGGRASWKPASLDPHLTVAAWVRNLTNRRIISNGIVSSDFIGYPRLGTLRDPRTYGVDLRFEF